MKAVFLFWIATIALTAGFAYGYIDLIGWVGRDWSMYLFFGSWGVSFLLFLAMPLLEIGDLRTSEQRLKDKRKMEAWIRRHL